MASDPTGLLSALVQTPLAPAQGLVNAQNTALAQQQTAAQTQQLQLANQQTQVNQANEANFRSDYQSYLANPSMDRLNQMAALYPAHSDALKQVYTNMDAARRSSIIGQYSAINNAAMNNRVDLVTKQIQQIRDAEANAGQNTSEADDILAQLGDATQQADAMKRVQGFAQMHIAHADPTLAKDLGFNGGDDYAVSGNTLFNKRTGQVVQQIPTPPDYVWDADRGQFFLKPGTGGGSMAPGGPTPSENAISPTNRTYGGWTPSVLNGGDNPEASVANKVAGVARILGVDPNADISKLNPKQIATALAYGEGGAGSLADRNNNPANLTDGKGGYRSFPTKDAGIAAAALQVKRNLARGQTTVASMVRGLPVNAQPVSPSPNIGQSGGYPSVVTVAPPKVSREDQQQQAADAQAQVIANIRPGDPSSLPAASRATVMAVAEGRAGAPRPGTRNGEALLNMVTAYDPTWDSSTQPTRIATAKAFTGEGKGAQAAASGNRLAYHLNDLYRASQALSGPDLGWTPLSNMAASAAQSFEGPAVKRYTAILPFVSGELQKLTKNGSATEGETRQIMANLQPAQSSAARLAAIQQLVDLAQGQFKPFRNQWASVFPNRPPPVDFTPTTQKIFDTITAGGTPLTVDHNGNEVVHRQGGSGGPVRVQSLQQALSLPKGTTFITPDGRTKLR